MLVDERVESVPGEGDGVGHLPAPLAQQADELHSRQLELQAAPLRMQSMFNKFIVYAK